MADIIYVLTLAFALPIVNAADNCKTFSLIGLTFSEYCSYGCCTDYDHVHFEKCCDAVLTMTTSALKSVDSNYAVGTIVGIVVGCVIVVGIIISVIVFCVCCTWNIRGMQGQTVTTVAGGPYVMNPMPHGVQMGQSPYGQQPYLAQPSLQTEHMAPGTTVVNNPGMQGPPSYEKGVDN